MMEVDAQKVAQKLATRVAQLEMELAVLQCALEEYRKAEQGQEPKD